MDSKAEIKYQVSRIKKHKTMEAVAKLNNYPTSPRKMRLLVDLIRGMEVEKALAVLEHNPKDRKSVV